MVTATKKKSHKELRAEAFNKVVGKVKTFIESSFRTGRADITLHHGKNIKGKLWEPGDDKIPARLNLTFLFFQWLDLIELHERYMLSLIHI